MSLADQRAKQRRVSLARLRRASTGEQVWEKQVKSEQDKLKEQQEKQQRDVEMVQQGMSSGMRQNLKLLLHGMGSKLKRFARDTFVQLKKLIAASDMPPTAKEQAILRLRDLQKRVLTKKEKPESVETDGSDNGKPHTRAKEHEC